MDGLTLNISAIFLKKVDFPYNLCNNIGIVTGNDTDLAVFL